MRGCEAYADCEASLSLERGASAPLRRLMGLRSAVISPSAKPTGKVLADFENYNGKGDKENDPSERSRRSAIQ